MLATREGRDLAAVALGYLCADPAMQERACQLAADLYEQAADTDSPMTVKVARSPPLAQARGPGVGRNAATISTASSALPGFAPVCERSLPLACAFSPSCRGAWFCCDPRR